MSPAKPGRAAVGTAVALGAGVLALPVLLAVTTVALLPVPLLTDHEHLDARGNPGITTLGVLVWITAGLLELSVLSLRWRTWPAWAAGLTIVALLQLDPLLLFVATGVAIAREPARRAQVATGVAAVVALIVLVRNKLWEHSWQTLFDPTADAHPGIRLIIDTVLTVGALGVAAAIGWSVRSRGERDRAESRAEQAEDDAAHLSARVSAVAERERLAREIHDALAHRLSLVSLHASALEEAVASDDPAVSEAARVIRDNAHRSLDDLRGLIDALRQPRRPSEGPLDPSPLPLDGMADVADVIDATVAAGVDVNAFVALDDPGSASDLLNHAVFRIVQESLTNVVKHAPGSRVGLDLRASPGKGVRLLVRNPLPPTPGAAHGSGMGLVGMQERVALLGGTMSCGPDGQGWFEVRVALPWAARETASHAATLQR